MASARRAEAPLTVDEKVDEYAAIVNEYFARALNAEERKDMAAARKAYEQGAHAAQLGLALSGQATPKAECSVALMKKHRQMMSERAGELAVVVKHHPPVQCDVRPAPQPQKIVKKPTTATVPQNSTGGERKASWFSFLKQKAKPSEDEGLQRAATCPAPAAGGASRTGCGRSPDAEALRPSVMPKGGYTQAPFAAPAPVRNMDGLAKELVKKYEKRFVEDILSDIVHPEDIKTTWGTVTGLEECKQHLAEAVVYPMLRADLFGGLRAPPRGVLLFGPPGNGKTLLAKAVAGESKAVFFSISSSSLVSKFLGDGEKLVKALFGCAEALAPSVVFIDEVDSLLSARGEEHDAMRRLKTEVLVQMDGVTTNADKRVLVLAATNRPGDIDTACLRRFSKRILIPLPDAGQRLAHLHKLLKTHDVRVRVSEAEFKKVAALTERYSFSDVTNLAREAAMVPLRDLGPHIVNVDKGDIRSVEFKDFQKALHVVRPSATEEECRNLEEWAKKYGTYG
eukprot:TRINITY_DN3679_c0_g3_i1.p1 TRINITY_DN3679_c0_g3~~TRINITY_DN3679_c0_g3_i1.p1  ORF type:complete len:510 (+),score=201.52 TRINITY_DN3679_c0_g3_i1:85-1614(+)